MVSSEKSKRNSAKSNSGIKIAEKRSTTQKESSREAANTSRHNNKQTSVADSEMLPSSVDECVHDKQASTRVKPQESKHSEAPCDSRERFPVQSIEMPSRRRDDDTSFDTSNPSRRKPVKMNWKRLVVLLVFLIIFPIVPLALSAALGGLLALVEGDSFMDGFLYVASNLLNLSTPLTDFNPSNTGGIIIDVYVSVVGFLTFGLVLNVVNIISVPIYVNQQIERLIRGPIIVPAIALGVVIPIYVCMVGIVFGSFLAFAEGWSALDGILYCFGNLLGLGTPLVDITPTTLAGDIFDIIISSLALGTTAVVVDYVTVLNPARHVRKRVRERLESMRVFDDDEPGIPGSHPLAYECDDQMRESAQHDLERREAKSKELEEEGGRDLISYSA